jgi:hypothetical protein
LEDIEALVAQDTGIARGSVEFGALDRGPWMVVLGRYIGAGGSLPEGMRGTSPEERDAFLSYTRSFGGTIGDAVAAKPQVYHEFLTNMRTNLQSRNLGPMGDTQAGGATRGETDDRVYPQHRHLTDFLVHFLTPAQIFHKGSPFSFGSWTNVNHRFARTNIVTQALRVAWYSTTQ